MTKFRKPLVAAAILGTLATLTSACAGSGGKPSDTAYVARDVETL